ncbi:replication-relaxation family protein [Streptomyces coriariae]|uniref:replication-relaxation family protein n=1 Tax=Streptomyces coriariae TaxID=2864460 RepID=UPI001E2A2D79|nr:replication-relaxation family protein [Streptomyces coriariae]
MTMARTRADVDAGGGDRLALAVLVQYRMATTEQMHLITAPRMRVEQTRRQLAKIRAEGLVDRITLPPTGRSRVWFATGYGVRVAAEWPELRGRRPPKLVSDPVAARLRVSHTLTVTETRPSSSVSRRNRSVWCSMGAKSISSRSRCSQPSVIRATSQTVGRTAGQRLRPEPAVGMAHPFPGCVLGLYW